MVNHNLKKTQMNLEFQKDMLGWQAYSELNERADISGQDHGKC